MKSFSEEWSSGAYHPLGHLMQTPSLFSDLFMLIKTKKKKLQQNGDNWDSSGKTRFHPLVEICSAPVELFQ